MKHIPTAKEPEKLKAAYCKVYGDTDWEFQNNDYASLEFRLLNDAYHKKFGDYVGNMCLSCSLEELNDKIRRCLKDGVPYDDGVPEGALI